MSDLSSIDENLLSHSPSPKVKQDLSISTGEFGILPKTNQIEFKPLEKKPLIVIISIRKSFKGIKLNARDEMLL